MRNTTKSAIKHAIEKIRKELKKIGLPARLLSGKDVVLQEYAIGTLFNFRCFDLDPTTEGFYLHSTKKIYIPAISLGCDTTVDVIRHELGHKLVEEHVLDGESKDFVKAFDDIYTKFSVYEYKKFDDSFYISDYAKKSSSEDFAETFMLYLAVGGDDRKIPDEKANVKQKFAGIRKLIKKAKLG